MKTIQQLACIVLSTFTVILVASGSVHGQGKLGRIREAVREDKPKGQPKPQQSPKETRQKRDREDDSRRDHKPEQRRRSNHRNRRHRSQAANPSFGAVWFSQPEPVRIVHHHIAPVTSTPVIVAAPQPAYETVVEQTRPIQPMEVQTPVAMPNTGESYFEHSPDFDWVARLSATGGTDFADIAHGSLGLLVQPRGGLGIDTSVTMFRESGMNVRDHLYLGDVNLTYEPVLASDRFRMRIGAGVNWLGDSYGGDAGFNMTGGLDWHLTDRWLVTGEVDFGTIGDTDLTHAQISLGRALSQQTELTFGYNYHDIGGVTMGSAFTGLRFRF